VIGFEERLRSELDRLVPTDSRSDWDEVAARAGLRRELVLRGSAVAVSVLAAAGLLAFATPLGATLAGSLDDFSAWLTGEPGTPASEDEQRAFEVANARSWLRFPQGTKLRHLITAKAADSTVELFGFRSGASSLCLRLKVTGETDGSSMSCAPLAELRRAGGPVRPVIVDYGVGKGDKFAWYGIDRVGSSKLQVTAGIAADAVKSVVLEDDAGRHEVAASSNAFLFVAERPDVGQRVERIWARTEAGLIPVPFAPAPFGIGSAVPTRPAPAAPPVEREVVGGSIGWLDKREPRGDSLDVLPRGALEFGPRYLGDVLFGRVLTPDPGRPIRVVVTLNSHRPGGPAAGLCKWLATRGGGGGGCSKYPEVFERTPITAGMMGSGSRAFVTITGAASDDVARIEALLSDGQRSEVPLADNVFLVELPRANLPARLIAYDDEDRVINVSRPFHDFGARGPGPARGRATLLLRVAGFGGATAELFVGPSADGGECMYVKTFVDRQHAGLSIGCHGRHWTGPALQLGTNFPPHFVDGRVRPDIKTVRLRFDDGSKTTLTPTRGYLLWAAPREHLEQQINVVAAEGLSADGSVLARQSLRPERPTRSRRSSSRD
jgi:hypothetical protein